MGGLQKVLEKYHLEKWFRKENLVVMILAGILLIVIVLPTKESSEKGESNREVQEDIWSSLEYENSSDAENTDTGYTVNFTSAMEYTTELEEKLQKMLSHIQGVGEVYVMITLKESEEVIVEKDTAEQQEQTIYETEGNISTPYVAKTVFPKVEGVVVVAQGAGTGKVTQNITEIIQALFDIEVHKIKVTAG